MCHMESEGFFDLLIESKAGTSTEVNTRSILGNVPEYRQYGLRMQK